jgi:imidazole glycerol-phosphate synthase subunit HisF
MLFPRITPCLLIRNKGLVKTVKFKPFKYIGDPINAVKIFNEKEADELIVLDIDASSKGLEPDFSLIKKLAAECQMPLCYGGGIKTLEHATRIIKLGVEKVAISSAFIENPNLLIEIITEIGSQSSVVILDVKKTIFGKYEVYVNNGNTSTGQSPIDLAQKAEKFGVGEVVINSIDNDGVMGGYDLSLASKVRKAVDIPISFLGGAGNLKHMGELIKLCGVIGVASGSFFVFKGSLRAVLINYPSYSDKNKLIKDSLNVS